MKAKTTVRGIEADEAEAARQLLDGALARNNMTAEQMSAALRSGYGRALHEGPPSLWTSANEDERHRDAAGRLLLRLSRLLGLPLDTQQGASAMSVLRELLG